MKFKTILSLVVLLTSATFCEKTMNTYSNQKLNPITVVGIARTFNLNDPNAKEKIGQFWQYFFANQILTQIPHQTKPGTIYSVYTDYDAQGNYSVILGAPVTQVVDIPTGMVSKAIPAAHYAVFGAKGPFASSLAQTWANVWQTKLNRAFTADFEVYDEKSTNDEKSIVNIYVALK